MKEREEGEEQNHKHVLGMVKHEKDGTYYPGCVYCREPIFVVKQIEINLKIKKDKTPV